MFNSRLQTRENHLTFHEQKWNWFETAIMSVALNGLFYCVWLSYNLNNIATLCESQGNPFQILKISASERLLPPLSVLHLFERCAAYGLSASLDFLGFHAEQYDLSLFLKGDVTMLFLSFPDGESPCWIRQFLLLCTMKERSGIPGDVSCSPASPGL